MLKNSGLRLFTAVLFVFLIISTVIFLFLVWASSPSEPPPRTRPVIALAPG